MANRLFSLLLFATACASVGGGPHAPTAAPIHPVIDSSCEAALDSLIGIFQRDYPGYREKVTGHEGALAALADSIRLVARGSDNHEVCIPALQRWAQFFRDPHVTGPWQSSPPSRAASAGLPPTMSVTPDSTDPARPSLRVLDDSTVLVRLPSFSAEYKPAIDSMIATSSARLQATPYLIVDVRGNAGGYTGSYDGLTPLLYANPVRFHGVDVWASRANLAYYRTMATASFLTAKDRALMQSLVSRMERHVDQFVEVTPDSLIQRDSVYPLPQEVVVLVDSGCASSCEDFVLEARQSSKVTVLGVNSTRGMHDYGEVHGVWLPGWRRVALPTSRTRGPRIDNVGLPPAVWIPRAEPSVVEFARRYLHSGNRTNR